MGVLCSQQNTHCAWLSSEVSASEQKPGLCTCAGEGIVSPHTLAGPQGVGGSRSPLPKHTQDTGRKAPSFPGCVESDVGPLGQGPFAQAGLPAGKEASPPSALRVQCLM